MSEQERLILQELYDQNNSKTGGQNQGIQKEGTANVYQDTQYQGVPEIPGASTVGGYVYRCPSGVEVTMVHELGAGETIKDPATGEDVVPAFVRREGEDPAGPSARTYNDAQQDTYDVPGSGKIDELVDEAQRLFTSFLSEAGADVKALDREIDHNINVANIEACLGIETESNIQAQELGKRLSEGLGCRVVIPEPEMRKDEGLCVFNVIIGSNRGVNESLGLSRESKTTRRGRNMKDRTLRQSRSLGRESLLESRGGRRPGRSSRGRSDRGYGESARFGARGRYGRGHFRFGESRSRRPDRGEPARSESRRSESRNPAPAPRSRRGFERTTERSRVGSSMESRRSRRPMGETRRPERSSMSLGRGHRGTRPTPSVARERSSMTRDSGIGRSPRGAGYTPRSRDRYEGSRFESRTPTRAGVRRHSRMGRREGLGVPGRDRERGCQLSMKDLGLGESRSYGRSRSRYRR